MHEVLEFLFGLTLIIGMLGIVAMVWGLAYQLFKENGF
jgi:hypothetical protein